jgi:hypothetical protein
MVRCFRRQIGLCHRFLGSWRQHWQSPKSRSRATLTELPPTHATSYNRMMGLWGRQT